MPRRVHSSVLLVSAALGVLAVSRVALGAPQDGAALKLRKQAIYTSYLATDFAAAEKALNKALTLCAKPTDCEPSTRSRLHSDLGAVLVADGKKDEATAQFTAALKDDPSITIDKDVTSPDAEQVFAAAKGGGGGAAGGGAAAGGGGAAGGGAAGGGAAGGGAAGGGAESGGGAPPATGAGGGPRPAPVEGDMKHTPIPESPTNTPIPIYAELPESAGAAKVYARYKPAGGDWKTAPLKKLGDGWGGEIPCGDVGDTPGDLKYFVQAASADGDVVASSGRLSAPHVIKIVAQLEGEAPHLPDKEPPSRCATSGDCPPDFPGCHAKEEKTSCSSKDDCDAGQTCDDGFCSHPGQGGEAEVPPKLNWFSINVQQDLLLLPSKQDGVCAGGSGYTCFDSGNTYFGAVPTANQGDDAVSGGLSLATTRFLLGYDRLFAENFMLGVRAGFVIGGGPQRPGGTGFLPVHLEGRFSYWFGHNPFGRKGFRFYAVAAGGMAEVDASLQTFAYTAPTTSASGQPDTGYNAWTKTGQGFVSVGLGGMYAITPGMGIVLEFKGMELLPTSGTAVAASLGYAIGF